MTPIRPEAAGMSSERLAGVDRFLQERYVGPGKLPFALLQVARSGQLVHETVLGHASIEDERPITPDAIVRIYSMTKPITSLALMMLVEEGRIALDDPVHRYIPAWRDLRVYRGGAHGSFETDPVSATAPMRIVDLLRHTSGLTYGFQERTPVDAAYRQTRADPFSSASLEDFIRTLAGLPLEFAPGTAWNYSVSTDVLGYLVGLVSGLPFDEFLRRRILRPLGMVDTDFHVPEDKMHRLAGCYMTGADGKLVPWPASSLREPARAPSGGGGLVSTIGDYMRFCDMLRRGGERDGVRLVGPKTLQLMRANHLPDGRELADISVSMFSEATFNGVGFGLGFAMTTDVARTGLAGSIGEYWWGGMASTAFWVDPVEDISVVLLTQLVPSSSYPIRRELRSMINAAVIESRA